ncbi:hypothetical protein [Actinomadura sp. DC4]|uniref:hypothetical protein n=1 Tax=Actinomadura sp. DC4 TaxID=3055069 RepID=UPI0025B0F320|nr:hypothetical protein [Actinomadura sp. DC4]MDN3358934.1 hypothetical protein [Actinomadura sp. DC4]
MPAAPVAIVAGPSGTARHGVIVKDGAALETLGRARPLIMDKTGEVPGHGTEGRVDGQNVVVGKAVSPGGEWAADAMLYRFDQEHALLRRSLERIRVAADARTNGMTCGPACTNCTPC